jgi:ribosome-associated protein
METMDFKLRGEHVALCDLLKLTGIADSGGQGKLMIANGEVTVDGQPESRKTAKIRAGQTVQCLGQTIRVVADEASRPEMPRSTAGATLKEALNKSSLRGA